MGDATARALFFERCPAPAAVVGFDGLVQDANPAWLQATGWRPDELTGRPLVGLVHPDDTPPLLELAGAWQGRVLRRDGSSVWMDWDVAAHPQDALYACVARPLPDPAVRRQERFRADFINMAAHELNTPLTPLQLALDTLQVRLEPDTSTETRQSLDIARRNVGRFKDLVAELLDAARLHAGHLPMEAQSTDLSALAAKALAAQAGAAKEAGVELASSVEAGLRARVDPVRLPQALGHALAFAIACAPPGGQVRLEVRRSGGEVEAEVVCPQARLAPSLRERLFLPFPASDDPEAPPIGTGLGLYLARGIVEQHGGRVAVHDGRERGLALAFDLPQAGPVVRSRPGRMHARQP
jgi:PAS domain S-box-containing protein